MPIDIKCEEIIDLYILLLGINSSQEFMKLTSKPFDTKQKKKVGNDDTTTVRRSTVSSVPNDTRSAGNIECRI